MTVFEKADRLGGLLRYGIPNFKMEKHLIDRRAGAAFGRRRGVSDRGSTSGGSVGAGRSAARLRRGADRDGRESPRRIARAGIAICKGIHYAMEYLTQQNRVCEEDDGAGADHGDGQAGGDHRRRRHRARIAWAPRTGSTPFRFISWSTKTRRLTSATLHAVADVADTVADGKLA